MDGAFRAAVHRDAVQCRLGPDGPPSHTHSKEKTRQMTSVRRMLTGFLLAIAAGFGWGSMGVAAQVMMTDGGFTAQDLVALRVFGAGVLLTLMTLLTERGRVSKLFSDMVLLRDVVIYGLGVLATQFTFFLAIRDAGAATAAIMAIRWSLWPLTVTPPLRPSFPRMIKLSAPSVTLAPRAVSTSATAASRSLSLMRSRAALMSDVVPSRKAAQAARGGTRSGHWDTSNSTSPGRESC